MNNKLIRTLSTLKKNRIKGFVACLTVGYPTMKDTVSLAKVLADNGADIIELCVPFSDPIADGPTIQYSSDVALKKGATLKGTFEIVKKIKQHSDIPVILMSYLNPIMNIGYKKLAELSKAAGVDGYIIADTIPEESVEVKAVLAKNNISIIPLVAPNTPKERLVKIDSSANGFVYIVSIAGVTGARKDISMQTKAYLKATKVAIKKHPRFVGFGISTPKHAAEIKKYVDGIIVASAIIDIIRNGKNMPQTLKNVAGFVKSIRKALD